MKALRLNAWKSDPVLEEVARPEPGPGEVLIQIGGAGACHSDLHLMRDFDGAVLPWAPPFTLGHENAGWVHAVGSGVTGVELGEPVAVVGAWGCGSCPRCLAGLETYCDDPELAPVPGGGGGLGLDGGMAEFMLVPSSRHLLRLPEGLDPVHAAPLTDAIPRGTTFPGETRPDLNRRRHRRGWAGPSGGSDPAGNHLISDRGHRPARERP